MATSTLDFLCPKLKIILLYDFDRNCRKYWKKYTGYFKLSVILSYYDGNIKCLLDPFEIFCKNRAHKKSRTCLMLFSYSSLVKKCFFFFLTRQYARKRPRIHNQFNNAKTPKKSSRLHKTWRLTRNTCNVRLKKLVLLVRHFYPPWLGNYFCQQKMTPNESKT